MVRKKKKSQKGKKGTSGRPRKYEEGMSKSDIYTSITVEKSIRSRLKQCRSKGDENYSDTIGTLMEIMDKMGKDYFGIEKPTPQIILDALVMADREEK